MACIFAGDTGHIPQKNFPDIHFLLAAIYYAAIPSLADVVAVVDHRSPAIEDPHLIIRNAHTHACENIVDAIAIRRKCIGNVKVKLRSYFHQRIGRIGVSVRICND
jgi:2-keto-4-pentenoate hydratase